MRFRHILVAAILVVSTNALAQIINPAPSGGFTDGAFNPTQQYNYVSLANAVPGTWDSPSSGAGVYDAEQWAVVYKYTSVNVAGGRYVYFNAHPTGAPVVWLVSGDVTITGYVVLDGVDGANATGYAAPGPGGFRGGKGFSSSQSPGSAGFGPGGGAHDNPGTGASYATIGPTTGGVTYGNGAILPLIGGSGGGGNLVSNYRGGGGGGAILIVANGTITVNGQILARGGNSSNGNYAGSGSGGSIRLVANTVTTGASSALLATAPNGNGNTTKGGTGRIRIEANTIAINGIADPAYVYLQPLPIEGAQIWPPATGPVVEITSVDGQTVNTDPTGAFAPPGDVLLNAAGAVAVEIQAANVPTSWTVRVRATLASGASYVVDAALASGDDVSSVWSTTLQPLPEGNYVALQAHATAPVTP